MWFYVSHSLVSSWLYRGCTLTDNIWELKQRRFWATYVNRKWGLFPCNMLKSHQNCTANCSFSYREDLQKLWVKPLPKDAKSPLPVYERRSRSVTLKLPIDPLHSFFNWILGCVSNDDGDVNQVDKKAMGLDWQNDNFALTSHFFVHFFAVVAKFHVLSRTGTQTTFFSFFSWTFIQSFKILLQRNLPIFNELNDIE